MLLAFQVPQGNLKLLDAHPELSPTETRDHAPGHARDRLHASPLGRSPTMVTVSSHSQMRVVLSRPPTAMLSLVSWYVPRLEMYVRTCMCVCVPVSGCESALRPGIGARECAPRGNT